MTVKIEQGYFNRRQALAMGGAAAATAVSLPFGRAHAATPKKGGHLRVASTGGATSDTLDPATISGYVPMLVNWSVRNCLVEIDTNGRAIPELAESWEASADAKTWTFKLRSGITFHNGKTLTQEDVVDSINYHRGDGSTSAAKDILTPITDIRTDGTEHIIFELSSANADFPFVLADFHLAIAPAGTRGKNWNAGIGTGGYILKGWSPGRVANLERNPDYWKEGRAHFDSIDILSVSDVSARSNGLLSDEFDVINNPDLRTIHLFERKPGIQIVNAPGTGFGSIPMHCNQAPFDNRDVRLALKYAIDRQAMLDTVLNGYGTIANDHPIGAPYRYHDADIPQRNYDPEKARFHLKNAGLTDLKVGLSAADTAFDGAVDAAVLFREQALKAGIDITVRREPNDGYWSDVWLKKPFAMAHWNGRPTADLILSVAFKSDAAWNDSFWKNETFDTLLVQARAELDEAKRAEMYGEMQSLIRDDGGTIIPFFDNYVMVTSDTVRHGDVGGDRHFDGLRMPERWWFA